MPDWRILFEAVVSESNPSVLEDLIEETENAILSCLTALPSESEGSTESREIIEAEETLRKLKLERLGYPSPMSLHRKWRASFNAKHPSRSVSRETQPASLTIDCPIHKKQMVKTKESLSGAVIFCCPEHGCGTFYFNDSQPF